MSSVIHGASHQILRHFRTEPAALSVYWIYCSRVNRDNVAYPTIRGLERDTGWGHNAVFDGRRWLVEHKALEKVEDYIRPEWRGLDKQSLAQRRNLDHAEYYRPTGEIEIEGKVYPLLHIPAREPSDIETVSDVPPQGTTPDVPPQPPSDGKVQNLIPVNTELDSIPTSPNGDVPPSDEKPKRTRKAKPAPKPKAPKAWDDVDAKTRGALIHAWWSSLTTQPTYKTSVYRMNVNHEMAAALHRAGYTPDDVKRYVVAMMDDVFWKDKTLTLSKVGELMPAWLKAHPAVTVVQSVRKPAEAELMGQLLA